MGKEVAVMEEEGMTVIVDAMIEEEIGMVVLGKEIGMVGGDRRTDRYGGDQNSPYSCDCIRKWF